jgi:flagellar basal-body rod modification protein FlgD
MTIDPISQPTTTPTVSATTPGLTASKDEFLKLFMAQLQAQDPLAPTSGADMVAQLAQLSSVEQAKQTNDQLADLVASQASNSSASLSSLVGRDCNAAADTFQITKPGMPMPPLDVSSSGPLKGASVVITDANGKELRRIAIPDGASSRTVAWDGTDSSGRPLPAGSYKISVDAGQTASAITSQWHGRVDAVELTGDGPRLRIGGLLLTPGEIRTIGANA